MTTSSPSARAWTSSSTKSAPSSIARSNAGSVFSGSSPRRRGGRSRAASPRAGAASLDVDALDQLVRRGEPLRRERAAARRRSASRRLGRRDAGLGVLERDDVGAAGRRAARARAGSPPGAACRRRRRRTATTREDAPSPAAATTGSISRAPRRRRSRPDARGRVAHRRARVGRDRRAVGDGVAVALRSARRRRLDVGSSRPSQRRTISWSGRPASWS